MKDLIIVGATRQASTRCKNKMVRKFGDTTLFDLYMQKLETLNRYSVKPYKKIILSLYPGDTTLWDIAQTYNIPIQERDEFSARRGELLSDILNYLNKYHNKYVMWLNSSLPFLQPTTIKDAAEYFHTFDNIEGLEPVKPRYNWFWMPNNNQPITVADKSHTRTQDALCIYESVHAFHIFNRKYMLKNDAYYNFTKDNPHLFIVEDTVEFFDINTEKDFKVAENIYVTQQGGI